MQFRSKPVVIEAINWNGSASALAALKSFVGDNLIVYVDHDTHDSALGIALSIRTLEGDMRASQGDWIIKGLRGEFYPCKPDVFAAKYEPNNA